MLSPRLTLKRLLEAALLCLFLLTASSAIAQQPTPTPPAQPDDVLRITTELVQTDVMVFDKSGKFIDGLKREQFELRVDGKPQEISFFDRVTSGSASEESQLAAARGAPRSKEEQNPTTVGLPDRGRTVIFFVDDIHMAFDSLRRTQKTLLHFINDEMGQNDQVAIASTSGRIGFLQQLTDNKTVLRAAVERLKLQPPIILDIEQPAMTESLAQAIIVLRDAGVLNFFVTPLVQQGMPAPMAEQMVTSRAQRILRQADIFARNTFLSLESLARNIAPLPGRKLVFFISDGFLLNTGNTELYERLSEITTVAARNGVVMYTMDARGLSTNSTFDATTGGVFDPSGRIMSATLGETSAQQEALRVLAANTGGRALLNTNALNAAITKTLKETATYYLIAWQPESTEQKSEKLRRIEVKIKGRPELTVQVRRGFLNQTKEETAKAASAGTTNAGTTKSGQVKTPSQQLRAAIGSFYSSRAIPTSLALNYLDSPAGGALLTVSMQIPAEVLQFEPSEGKFRAEVDVEGYVYNDQGKVGFSFNKNLKVTADALETISGRDEDVYYTEQVRLAPGLYQARVAARDAKTGRIGVATQWVEIPDLKSQRLTMSSLLIGESKTTASAPKENKETKETKETDANAIPEAQLSVAHRFARTSRLRFLTFVYNAARGTSGAAAPDVAIQIQVMRDDQPILTTSLRKITTEGLLDIARLPYAAEIPLDNMLAGRYVLQVTAIDRVAKTSASQRVNFEIE
jgi:VWFA-related protein